jgi:hypothetical protein
MDSFKVDTGLGLIYGPFKAGGRFISAAVFSMTPPRSCVYCRALEPRCRCNNPVCTNKKSHGPYLCRYPLENGEICSNCKEE